LHCIEKLRSQFLKKTASFFFYTFALCHHFCWFCLCSHGQVWWGR